MWLAYVNVDDIAGSTAKAESLGATIIRDITEVPGIGWFSIIMDPTGAGLALWKGRTPRLRRFSRRMRAKSLASIIPLL